MSTLSDNSTSGAVAGAGAGAGAGYQTGGGYGALIGAVVGAGVGFGAGQHYGRGLKKRQNAMEDAQREYLRQLQAERASREQLFTWSKERGNRAVGDWRTAFTGHLDNSQDPTLALATNIADEDRAARELAAMPLAGPTDNDAFSQRAYASSMSRASAAIDPITASRGATQVVQDDQQYAQQLQTAQAVYESALADAGRLTSSQRGQYEADLQRIMERFAEQWREAQHAGDRQLALATMVHTIGNAAAMGGAGGAGSKPKESRSPQYTRPQYGGQTYGGASARQGDRPMNEREMGGQYREGGM